MRRVQESKCAICGAWCQGFESEYGIICADCLKRKKEFGRGKLMTDVCKLIITKGFQNRYAC